VTRVRTHHQVQYWAADQKAAARTPSPPITMPMHWRLSSQWCRI